MPELNNQLESYRLYHLNRRNKATHFVGIPLVIFALFIFLGWFRFTPADLPLSAGTLSFIGVLTYYCRLHRGVAFAVFLLTLPLFLVAEEVAVFPLKLSATVCALSFGVGMAFQFLGHYFEGKRPAFTDNFSQTLNGPLFLTVEILSLFGFKP